MEEYLASCPEFRGSERVAGDVLKSLARILPRYEYREGEVELFKHYLTGLLYRKAMREISRTLRPAERPKADEEEEKGWWFALCALALFETLGERALPLRSREIFRRISICKENARDAGFDLALSEEAARRENALVFSHFRRLVAALAKLDGAKPPSGLSERFLAAHDPINVSPLFEKGDTFGAWRVAAYIGRGDTCELYRVVHISLSMHAALKVLVSTDPVAKGRFEQSVRFLFDNKASFIPQCLGSGEKNSHAYCVMEFLSPCEVPSSDKDAAKFLIAAAQGVEFIHSKGVARLYLSLANIMKRQDGSFSLASITAAGNEKSAKPRDRSEARYSDIRALGRLAKSCVGGYVSGAWQKIIRLAENSRDGFGYNSAAQFALAVAKRHRTRHIAIFLLLILAAAAAAWFYWGNYKL